MKNKIFFLALAFLAVALDYAFGMGGEAGLAFALITGELDDITTATDCSDKAGIRVLYWAEYSDIDWVTMAGDPADFDTTTRTILDYAMIGGAVFNKVEFERKQAFYDFTYTEDGDEVALLISMLFKGKDNARKNSLDEAVRACNIVAHVFDENGKERVVGVDWDGVTFKPIIDYLSVGRILDSSGQRGSSKARDEMDLTGAADFLPLFSTVGESSIPV